MPTGTGRGGGRGGDDYQGGSGRGGSGRGGDGQGKTDSLDYDAQGNRIRIKIGVAWINGDGAAPYLNDMLADKVYLRYSPDEHDPIPEGWKVFGFPNKNKQGKAPDIDFVALPPKD